MGDPILDKYRYVSTIGTSSKAPSIAALNEYEELYKGGSIAVAEMLAALDFSVELICYRSQKINCITKFLKILKYTIALIIKIFQLLRELLIMEEM